MQTIFDRIWCRNVSLVVLMLAHLSFVDDGKLAVELAATR